jgi:hypothetical protein
MKRLLFVLTAVLVFAPACRDDGPTQPSTPTDPRFTATLLPANEVPPVSNAEASGTGTVVITLHITRDAAQTITAATADFQVTLTGFPAGTPVTAAHIHNGRAGVNASPINNLGLVSGEVVLVNGSGSFTKNGITFNSLTHVQNILNDFTGFYFNVHSTLNPGGFARGQLAPMP